MVGVLFKLVVGVYFCVVLYWSDFYVWVDDFVRNVVLFKMVSLMVWYCD